jgi:hypothetical protein
MVNAAEETRSASADRHDRYAPPEQRRYASVLGATVRLGLALLVASFTLYMLGIPRPWVAMDQLPLYWGLPAEQFVKATHTPTGWAWLAMLDRSDILNLAGIAVLASASAVGSVAVLPMFARRSDIALLVVTLLLLVVLAVSASNLLAAL